MPRNRYALIAALCIFALGCLMPAPGAFAGAGVQVHKHHRHHKRHHRGHRARRARCSARAARAHRVHARRSSFHSDYVLARPHCGARHTGHAGARHAAAPARQPAAASDTSACADADLTPAPDNLERVRAATLCLVNRERTGHGESALISNARLAQAAQAHSEDMAAGDYFDHVSPQGSTPVSRMRACGYIYSSRIGYEVGENIAWGTLWLATPRAIVAAWMNSPEHRANILNGDYRDTAIGVAPRPIESLANGQAGGIYTQDFGLLITA